ncbi:ataxin-1 isoform X4 [Anopheles gambiae]|uniref:ataxin-1 isoform X4 n=1 Tax=Anopheles gambiae TaxID=7165 RepID=UPI002AC9524F|nr:ataxin-1 isoform X4 [Anopheles gambiae]
MKFMQNIVLLLLLSSSCWADGQPQPNQQSVQPEQSHSLTVGENVSKNVAGVVDKSQNKRGAPDIPVVVGTPTQHTAYINHHVTGATVVAAPISGHSTHAAIGAVPFGYGHAVSSAGHILQTPSIATGHQHVIHKVNYVAPASTTTLKLATVSEGSHLHLQPVSSVVTKYNYAVPQLSYAHYPQYQVYHHNQPSPGTLQPTGTTIFAAHQLHDHPVATVHEIAHQHHPQQQQQQHQQQQHQQQQHTAYAHQQPIYAHHPAAIHFTVPASVVHAGQHNYQQQQQLPLTHTQAIHYQANQAGGQPAVPIVHQAPIATINQVHQAQQVYAAQGQLTKYPLAAQSYYGAGGLQQNQIYSTVPSYGDPDTLTNLVNPTTPQFLTTPRRQSTRPIPGDIRPITEYDDDDDNGSNDGNNEDGVLYRDESTDTGDRNPARDEPCEKDGKKSAQPSAFNRNLYNMWRAYDVARTLLKASGASGAPAKPRSKPDPNTNTDRIQLIHPPGESDKKLKGKYYEGKYNGYYRHGRQDAGDQHGPAAHGDGNRKPKSVQPNGSPSSAPSPSSSSSSSGENHTHRRNLN